MIIRALLLVAVLIVSGCQTKTPDIEHPHLVIGPRASSYLQIEGVQDGTASGDLLRAGVRLHSISNVRQTLRFRFEWLDASGFELRGLAGRWERLELRPQVSQSLDRIAPSPKATNYSIHLFDINTPANVKPHTSGSNP
ncbi:DUF1425 domain-containing protein [Pseudomonas sp. NPDC077382]